MPGMVGLITRRPRQWAEPQLRRMLEGLHREPFYAAGTWIDEALGVYVGWTSLQTSASSAMPTTNEAGDVSLVFSGQEYSCGRDGASSIVRLYEEDSKFPDGLNGVFHGLVADRRNGTALVFNDRYGMHRLCYHESKEAFYFAAEAKAILRVRPETRVPCLKSLGEFVACSCVLEDRTIFEGIQVLPGGSAWMFRNGSLERRTAYFSPDEWEGQDALDPQSYHEALRGALVSSLPRYFAGPEQVGIALTGGMDTRVILACYRPDAWTVPCYTFGSSYRECQDVRIARKVAAVCEQNYDVITVGDEFLRAFPYYAGRCVALTEGGVDVSRSADLYVSEKARAIAPAKVVGTYGSEIVRHAVMFKPIPLGDGVLRPEFLAHVRDAQETYRNVRRAHPVTFAAFRQSPWYHHGVLALERSQLEVRSPYLDNDFVRTVYRAPAVDTEDDDPRLRLIAAGSQALRRIRSDRGIGGKANALTAQLSHLSLEFTFKAEYAYDYGMPQWVAAVDHRLSALHLERLFLGRHKFLHYRVWYRNQLSDYVRQILLDPLTLSRPYIEPKRLEALVMNHAKGDRNYTTSIHKLLTLELLQRLFFDGGVNGDAMASGAGMAAEVASSRGRGV